MKKVYLLSLFLIIMLIMMPLISADFFPYYNSELFTAPNVFDTSHFESVSSFSLPLFTSFFDKVEVGEGIGVKERSNEDQLNVKKNLITITDNGFEPSEIFIFVNQPLIWDNQRYISKALVLGMREISEMKTNVLKPGESFIWEFSQPGEYTYVDGIVIGTVGKIVVQ